jgi:hypothetical protein
LFWNILWEPEGSTDAFSRSELLETPDVLNWKGAGNNMSSRMCHSEQLQRNTGDPPLGRFHICENVVMIIRSALN